MSGLDLDLAIKIGIPLTSAALGYWQRKRIKDSIKKTDANVKEWMRLRREQKEAEEKQKAELRDSLVEFSNQPLVEVAAKAFDIKNELESSPEAEIEAAMEEELESEGAPTTYADEKRPLAPLGKACPGCGGPITKDQMSCPGCATVLRKRCPDCQALLEASWSSCPSCSYRYPKLYAPPLPPKAEKKADA